MKIKIGLAQALKVAKSHGYTGSEDFEPVKKWFEANCRPESEGSEFEVVAKSLVTKTVTVMADAGEQIVVQEPEAMLEADPEEEDKPGEMMPKSITTGELKALREKARLHDAAVGSGRVNKANAAIAGGYSAGVHNLHSTKKAYNRRVAGDLRPGQKAAVWSDADEAEAWGSWLRLTFMGHRNYGQKAADLDIVRKASVTTTFTSTGALVPPGFSNRLIELRESYGIAESLAQNEAMSSDVQSFPRKTGNLTAYSPGEAGTTTESNMAFDQVEIIARKRAVLTTISSESIEDSSINLADTAAEDIARTFAQDIDDRWINGDGTSTYAGDVGMRQKLLTLSATRANIAGMVVATGNLFSEFTLADFQKVQGRLPDFYGVTGDPVWLVNKRFYYEVMERLMLASGGVTSAEIAGKRVSMFLGDRVVFARSMPRADANDAVAALYGHFDLGSMFGSRRTLEIATSLDRYFEMDKIGIRGTQRAGITVHDVGDANATEASRNPGPIVGLASAAS